MSDNTLSVGLIGAGNIAGIHAGAIQATSGAHLVAVADADGNRAAALAKRSGLEAWYDDPLEMIERHSPDVVHVLVPPQHHAAMAIAALENGCHALVEKPLAINAAEGERILQVARAKKLKLCANHNLLYEDLVQKALQLVADGAVGEVTSAEASLSYDISRNPALADDGAQYGHWSFRLNGGPLQDLLPHPASLVAELLGDVEGVHAVDQNRGRLPEGFGDELIVLVKARQASGTIRVSLNERPDTVTLSIRGRRGRIDVDLFSNILMLNGRPALPRPVARGISGFKLGAQQLRGALRNSLKVGTGRIDKTGGIGPLIAAFYRSVSDDAPVPVSEQKALRVVEIIDCVWPRPVEGVAGVLATLAEPVPSKPERARAALVTGASGFIGSHLVSRLLGQGVHVRALVRPSSAHWGRVRSSEAELFEADLADVDALREATKGVEVIYHLGGAVGNDWEEHEVTTIDATRHLIESAIEHGVKRLVYVSSLAVCDIGAANGDAVDEEVPYAGKLGPYARAKMEAERIVLDANSRGLAATVIRPGIVFGPRGRVRFPHLGFGYKDQIFVILGRGKNSLPLTYVENTVDALCKAATSEQAPGQVYHIVDDGQVTAREYVERLVRVAELDSKVVRIPFLFAYLAAAVYELGALVRLLPPGVTSRKQLRQKRSSTRFDCSKAKRELGWAAEILLEDGLDRTFRWYGAKHG